MKDIDPTTSAGATDALETMWRIRVFEQALEELFQRGRLHGTMHLSIGQEAVPTGVCAALSDGDMITSTHRGHGHCLAHDADPVRMMAELLGRDSGYCRGRGGSMHIADVAAGNLGANGIVAGSMTIATGAALTQLRTGGDRVVVCFFGDGAANEGAFHESLNLAGVWGVPVVFVCENNQYGMSMSVERSTAGKSIAGRAEAYGMPGREVDGNDVVEVYHAAVEAVAHARQGAGPTLLECMTYRWRGHSKSDRNLYRTTEEIDQWRNERDPIERYERRARSEGWLDDAGVEEARTRARTAIRDAVAQASRGPHPTVEDLEGSAYA